MALEEGGVVLGEVRVGGGIPPLHRTLVGLQLAGEDLEQGGMGVLVVAHEGDLVVMVHDEGDLVQRFTPSMVLETSVTKRMSLPTSRSGEKATQG